MHKLKSQFPTFLASGRLVADIVSSEWVALLGGVAICVLGVFLIGFVAGMVGDSNGRFMSLLKIWSCSAIAVMGAWTSLGSGAWHWRFLAGIWASLCVLAAFISVCDAPAFGIRAFPERFPVQAALIYACSAFGAQWLGSVANVRILRQPRPAVPNSLRAGQFNIAALLLIMAIVAAFLGMIRIVCDLLLRWQPRVHQLVDGDIWVWVLYSSTLALVAVAATLRSGWKLALLVLGVLIALWIASHWDQSISRSASRSQFVRSIAYLMWPVAPTLLIASTIQWLWLRVCGFRLLPSDWFSVHLRTQHIIRS
ncbi:MAG TPA: hypothetical protein VFV87_11490 [Pirellulaceae bacterium]|nr:hypothetical protein [Pirellulaceae bacterium]